MILANASLHIENVTVPDEGEYICSAKNEYGTATMTFNLNILSMFLNEEIVDAFLHIPSSIPFFS